MGEERTGVHVGDVGVRLLYISGWLDCLSNGLPGLKDVMIGSKMQ